MTAQEQLEARLGNYIPETLYVARQARGTDGVIGFVVPVTGDEKWNEKRQATADAWSKGRWDRADGLKSVEVSNDWAPGFTMIQQVRRDQSDAVYWRVLHPLGFEFEMSLDNFEYFLNKYTLDIGLIAELKDGVLVPVPLQLVYNKSNSKWILVDKEHSSYKKAVDMLIPGCKEHTDLIAQAKADEKATRKTLDVGDVFKYCGSKATFLGTYSVAFPDKVPNKTPTKIKRMKVIRVSAREYIGNTHAPVSKYYFLNQLQVHEITSTNPENYDKDKALAEVRNALTRDVCLYHKLPTRLELLRGADVPVGVWWNKPKSIEQVVEPVDLSMLLVNFHPNLLKHDQYFKLPNPYILLRDTRRYYDWEPNTANVMVRDKRTGELFECTEKSNSGGYHRYTGFNYGFFDIIIKDHTTSTTIAKYYDADATIRYSDLARRERARTWSQIQKYPEKTDYYKQTLASFEASLDEKVKSAQAEGNDKTWVFHEDYELVHISYK